MSFEKIEIRKKSSYVVDQILEAIKDGEYEIGSKLPAEREIAEKMDVSRTSVREAFIELRLSDIIESKTGDGTYVNKIPDAPNGESLQSKGGELNHFEVLTARKEIESCIAKQALINMNEEDLSKIKEKIGQMEEAYRDGNFQDYLELQWNFHELLAQATHNEAFVIISDFLLGQMKKGTWKKFNEKYHSSLDKTRKSFEDHYSIFVALKNSDEDKLLERIKKHFANIRERLDI